MARIEIVYFSGYGHTHKQAEAVAQGAGDVAGAQVNLLKIDETGELPEDGWARLAQADAIIFGSPTYMGGAAWQFKKFADASSKIWFEQGWKDKFAGGFTTSASVNGDKAEVLGWFVTLAMQHGLIWVGSAEMPSNTKTAGPQDVNWTGSFTGAMAIAPADAAPEEAPRAGDLETARRYGARIATMATARKGG